MLKSRLKRCFRGANFIWLLFLPGRLWLSFELINRKQNLGSWNTQVQEIIFYGLHVCHVIRYHNALIQRCEGLVRKIVFHSLTGQVKKHTQYWNERYFVLIVVLCNIFPAIVSIHIHKCFSESGPYLSPFHYFFFRAGFVSDPNWTLRVTSTGKNVIKFFYKEMKIPLICLAVTCRYVGRISVVQLFLALDRYVRHEVSIFRRFKTYHRVKNSGKVLGMLQSRMENTSQASSTLKDWAIPLEFSTGFWTL